jgi:hypothetical protein
MVELTWVLRVSYLNNTHKLKLHYSCKFKRGAKHTALLLPAAAAHTPLA